MKDQRSEPVILDGEMLPAGEAALPYSAGTVWGLGVFETMRAAGGRALAFGRHWERLQRGLSDAGLAFAHGSEDIRGQVERLAKEYDADELSMRLTLYASGLPLMESLARPMDCGYLLAARRIARKPNAMPEKIEPVILLRADEHAATGGAIKSLSRHGHFLARKKAMEQGAAEAILLDDDGMVLEGSMSNFYLLDSDAIVTRPLDGRILGGIVRSLIEESAANAGLRFEERTFAHSDLEDADCLLLSSASIGVVPVQLSERAPSAEALERVAKLQVELETRWRSAE